MGGAPAAGRRPVGRAGWACEACRVGLLAVHETGSAALARCRAGVRAPPRGPRAARGEPAGPAGGRLGGRGLLACARRLPQRASCDPAASTGGRGAGRRLWLRVAGRAHTTGGAPLKLLHPGTTSAGDRPLIFSVSRGGYLDAAVVGRMQAAAIAEPSRVGNQTRATSRMRCCGEKRR